MAEEQTTTETGGTEGQAGDGPQGVEATQAAPGGTEGQSGGVSTETTDTGTQETTEDTFFDPQEIADDPRLMAAYKNMQRSYGEKTQAIAEDRKVIEAFRSDPMGTLQQYAKQLGFTLTPVQQQQQNGDTPASEPQTWDEVFQTAEQKAYDRIMGEMRPVMGQMLDYLSEKKLDDVAPDWREHKDTMDEIKARHPTLAGDPELLYRLSVPKEVQESRATQAAMRKLQDKVESAKTSGVSTKKPTAGVSQAKTIREAFAEAQKEVGPPPGAI